MDKPYNPGLSNGFTLLELLAAIAIAAILMGIGIPSFNSFIRDSTLRTDTNALSSSFALARSEAIRRGENVNVTAISALKDWKSGWRLWVDSNNNNTYDAGTDDLIRVFDGTSSTVTATQDKVIFSHDGGLVLTTNDTPKFDIKPPQNCQNNEQRHLNIEASGRVDFSQTTCS